MPGSDLLYPAFSKTGQVRTKRYIMGIFAALSLMMAGCSNSDNADIDGQADAPVDQLYNDALNTVLAGDVDLAAPKFEEVERQHPYSIWAVRAQIMAAWSFYQSNQYAQAEASLDRFIELYPADPLTEYAYYLKALSYYEQIVDVERDADMTYKALNAFEDVLRRYPDGPYARDSQLKADLARSHLAGKEMAVARFYLNKGHYAAAIKRFAVVVRDYDRTNQVPEALYRMGEAYLSLSLDEEAMRVLQVAEYNYPESVWTERLIEVVGNPSRSGPQGILGSVADRALSLFQ
ncbi:MAG: outer membrane protein assembly factor BamD [Candidatus Puniceispirillaceae bacterium]|jgi:outer membrane protein assembly factor BamD